MVWQEAFKLVKEEQNTDLLKQRVQDFEVILFETQNSEPDSPEMKQALDELLKIKIERLHFPAVQTEA